MTEPFIRAVITRRGREYDLTVYPLRIVALVLAIYIVLNVL